MNKTEILNDYKNEEERLLIANCLDKLEFSKSRNKIEYTDFLNLHEQDIVDKLFKKLKIETYYFFGGVEEAERKVLIIYPEKLTEEMARKNHTKIMQVVTIKLPNDLEDEYDHRTYLGAIMKVGIKREKIGDIFVRNLGADIFVKEETKNSLIQELKTLTRFQKAEIEEKDISLVKKAEVAKVEITVIVASLRLDSIVSSLARTSRNKAIEILNQERVFLNFQNETKASKQVKVGDCITIRGKGRFEFREISGNTKKGRYVIKIDKYV